MMPEKLYDDLKIMIVDSGYVYNENGKIEEPWYDEHLFAVRKKWLFEYYKNLCDHDVTEEDMEIWLMQEYCSDDSILVYRYAKEQGELIFETPVTNGNPVKRELYVVKEYVTYDKESEVKTFCITTLLDRAMKEYAKQKKLLYADKDVFFDVKDLEELRDENGLPHLGYDEEDGYGTSYSLCVEKIYFEDGGVM